MAVVSLLVRRDSSLRRASRTLGALHEPSRNFPHRSARGEAGAHQQVGRQRGGGVRVRGVCDVGPSCLEAVH